MALLLEMRGISPDGDVSVIARLVTRHRPGPYPQVGEVLRRLRRWPLRLPVPPTTALGLVRCAAAGGWAMLGSPLQDFRRTTMGKYLLAWLLGVPGLVLLLVYLFFN
ncbi:hypothetical protein [Pelomonas sp. Root1444]|uniref:hypothetical protein n=1 Tax=Pelomonas sp. Root1444 TaxID=1736464 RepID=UPI001F334C57|nr:hypothetical protein [Pelomonas sp. Root1444]